MKITHIGTKPDKDFRVDLAFEHGTVVDVEESYGKTHMGKLSLEALHYLKTKGVL